MISNLSFKTAAAVFVLAALPAVSAFANDSNYPGPQASSTNISSNTRADVRSDYAQSKTNAPMVQGDQRYPTGMTSQPAVKTRAEVRAELATAHARRGQSALTGDNYFPQNSNVPGDFAGG